MTSTVTPAAQATIAAEGAVSATTLSGGASTPTTGPITWEDGSRTVSIHSLTADANLIVLGFTVEDKSLSPSENRQIVWVASPVSVTTIDGVQLPALESEIGWQWSPSGGTGTNGSSSANSGKGNISDGTGQDALIGTRAAFDASLLSSVSTTILLRVVTDIARQPSGVHPGPSGAAPSPQPTQPLPSSALVPIHVDRVIQIPFDPLRRVAEPHLSVEGRGITLTLDRVQVTASETRLYITGKIPQTEQGGGPQLSGDANSWSLYSEGSGFSYFSGRRVSNAGSADQWVYRIGAPLIDKPSPWILTLPAGTEMVPPGSSDEHGPWRGPWRFRFGLPAAEASLTPGVAPTLPPATPWPTDVPGAEPTFVGPLHGPVPSTATP